MIEDNIKRFSKENFCSCHCEPWADSGTGRSNLSTQRIASPARQSRLPGRAASTKKNPRNDIEKDQSFNSRVSFVLHDLIKKPLPQKFDAAYSLDVIEHISTDKEEMFMQNLCASLHPHAVCILGTPNKDAQAHASEHSRAGHINLKTAETLRNLLEKHFHNVFLFSMNDEVIHTGFHPMAHYLFGMGVGGRRII